MSENIQGNLLFMYTETPLHAGTGSTVSVIDLPIQRERTTNFPNVQGSGIKGALRAYYDIMSNGNKDLEANILTAFGPNTNNAGDHAGSATFGEARVVLFPVRSLLGVFAHVTCPFVLGRLARDMQYAGLGDLPSVPNVEDNNCLVGKNAKISTGSSVVLEEYAFEPTPTNDVDELASWLAENAFPTGGDYTYWRERLASHLVILPDDAFRDFVTNSTEISTHIKIDNAKKTVATGALWTKESLPADTLMVSTIMARASRSGDRQSASQVMSFLQSSTTNQRIQLAGDETTGNGVVALKWFK